MERVCASGYSEILRNLLAEVGIRANVISGGPTTKGKASGRSSHAWNQVYLDGKWYNCDITNDADFIKFGLKLPYFLKSNDEFGEGEDNVYVIYNCKNPEMLQDSNESISEELQEQLLDEQRERLILEKKSIENETKNETKNKSFLDKLKDFFEKRTKGKQKRNDNEGNSGR